MLLLQHSIMMLYIIAEWYIISFSVSAVGDISRSVLQFVLAVASVPFVIVLGKLLYLFIYSQICYNLEDFDFKSMKFFRFERQEFE